jgi:hypothetical protein
MWRFSNLVRALRIAACIVIGLCVLEACARVDDFLSDGAPLIGRYGYAAMLTYDDTGVVGKPYGHYRKWTLNSQGYRGPDIRWDRERIITIGASETFGFTESEGMEYPRQLERELNKRVGYERYQVVNVAYAGQSIGAFCRRADRVAATVRPSIALIYPSSSSYFVISSHGEDEVGWVKPSRGFEARVRTKFFDLVDTLPPWFQEFRAKVHIWREVRRNGTIARIPEANLVRFREDLDQLVDRLQRDHVEPVLMTHATRFGKRLRPEDRPMLIAWRRFTPTLQDAGFLDFENRFNDVIRQEAASRGLRLIDAADRLSGQRNFADFAHFTDQGAHAMAEVIASGLLADRPEPQLHASVARTDSTSGAIAR